MIDKQYHLEETHRGSSEAELSQRSEERRVGTGGCGTCGGRGARCQYEQNRH